MILVRAWKKRNKAYKAARKHYDKAREIWLFQIEDLDATAEDFDARYNEMDLKAEEAWDAGAEIMQKANEKYKEAAYDLFGYDIEIYFVTGNIVTHTQNRTVISLSEVL